MFLCPICKSKTKVIETRSNIRQRECVQCGDKFITEEVISGTINIKKVQTNVSIIRKKNKQARYDKDKYDSLKRNPLKFNAFKKKKSIADKERYQRKKEDKNKS